LVEASKSIKGLSSPSILLFLAFFTADVGVFGYFLLSVDFLTFWIFLALRPGMILAFFSVEKEGEIVLGRFRVIISSDSDSEIVG
jgi:hypothetical protein